MIASVGFRKCGLELNSSNMVEHCHYRGDSVKRVEGPTTCGPIKEEYMHVQVSDM